jgi:aryl-alcohol dehydrogenase-like predicted oxidoreductase
MNFGSSAGISICDAKEAGRIIDAFLEAGHNVIDTADEYNGGESEEIIGVAIRERRDSLDLATKAGHSRGTDPNQRGLSRMNLTRALEASLRRLGTEYVDLYQCHIPDPGTPIEETMATLDGFVRAGKVRYLGCSNFTAVQIVEAQWAAEKIGGTAFISHQSQYSLVARDIEAEILPTCQRHGLGTLTWSPLGAGILAGRYQRGSAAPVDSRLGRVSASSRNLGQYWASSLLTVRKFAIVDEVARIATDLGVSSVAVAISWLRQKNGVTSIVIGPRTLGHLDENLAGLDLDLPAEALVSLEKVTRPTAIIK